MGRERSAVSQPMQSSDTSNLSRASMTAADEEIIGIVSDQDCSGLSFKRHFRPTAPSKCAQLIAKP